MNKLTIVVLAGMLALGGCKEEAVLKIAERGKPAETVIVLPDGASESQKYAAEELRKYVEQMTGVKLEIGKGSGGFIETAIPRKRIVFQTTDEFGEDGFELKTEGRVLYIRGSARRGCLYGAYGLLERQGCRFFSETFEKVPELAAVEIAARTNFVERPSFPYREMLVDSVGPELKAKRRNNQSTWEPIPEKFGGCAFTMSKKLKGHTFEVLIDPKKEFDKHPEYFSLVNGKRLKDRTQLCLSNPEVFRICRDKILEAMRNEPEATLFTVTPNDWYNSCECEKCKAVDEQEGSNTGSYLKFLNALAEETSKEFPNKYLRGSAYQQTKLPPKTMKLHKNLFFGFAPVECDFSTRIDKSEYEWNKKAAEIAKGWAKNKGGVLSFTFYPTNFKYYPAAFPDVDGTAANMRYLHELGYQNLYFLGSHEGRGGFMTDLRTWVYSKLAWDISLDEWELAKEFCDGFYGEKAGPIVYNYMRKLHALPRDTKVQPLTIFLDVSDLVVTDEFLRWALGEWNKAEELVKDDPKLLDNVRYGKYSTVFQILRMHVPAVCATTKLENAKELQELAKWMVGFVESKPKKHPTNFIIKEGGQPLVKLPYYQTWKELAEKGATACTGRGVAEENAFIIHCPGTWAKIVDDKAAANGKAAKIFPTCNSWSVQFDFSEVMLNTNMPYRVRARVRIPRTAKAAANARVLTYGISNRRGKAVTDRNKCEVHLTYGDLPETDDYFMLDLRILKPMVGEYLWFAIGGYQNKGFVRNEGMEGVWIDGIEFCEMSENTKDLPGVIAVEAKNNYRKEIIYDKPDKRPLIFGGWSKSEDAKGFEYCLYVDMFYDDGKPEWGLKANFDQGTHDWMHSAHAFVPKKPIKKVVMHAFLRNEHNTKTPKGKVKFRNIYVERRNGIGDYLYDERMNDRPYGGATLVNRKLFDGQKEVTQIIEDNREEDETPSTVKSGTAEVWTADSMRRVYPLTFPTAGDTRSIELEAAKGECESAQVLVSTAADTEWKRGMLRISELKNEDGETLKGEVKWERLGYIPLEPEFNMHEDDSWKRCRWIPDPILPAREFKVLKNSTQALWVTVKAGRDAKAGTYRGTIEVSENGVKAAEVPMTVKVRNFSLPERFGLKTALSVMDCCTLRRYPKNYDEMRRKSHDVMLDCRLNPDDITRTSPPLIEDLKHAKARGMNCFNIFNVVPPPKSKDKMVLTAKTGDIFNDKFYNEFIGRLKPYVAELKKNGLADMAYVYGFDERESEFYEGIDKMWKKMRKDVPGIPLFTTAKMYADWTMGKTNLPCLVTTDWYCPCTYRWNEKFNKILRKAGKQIWWYTCCGPRYPYANPASIVHPPMEGRLLLGFMTHWAGADGFLFWLVNGWYPQQKNLDENETYFPEWHTRNRLKCPGDGVFMYPGERNIYPSVRLVQARDGVEDYEWLQLATRARAGKVVKDAEDKLVKTLVEYSTKPEELRAARTAVGDAIEAVQLRRAGRKQAK